MLNQPVSVYINWSAYDELSDCVELTEALALSQLDQLLRWRRLGAKLDYYIVDAFWYAHDGGLRTFRAPHWPEGPERFFARCQEHHVLPGLWLPTNNQGQHAQLDVIPEWADSWDAFHRSFCMFHGGFFPHFMETMHRWYIKGVRAFKFDFANFHAAPPEVAGKLLPSEIWTANLSALRVGLLDFRKRHPEVLLLGYNGFEEVDSISNTSLPFRKTIDLRWLDAFDSLYCGDPRPADVPAMNFWRSKDVYSDHMLRSFQSMGFPLARIDNAGFMIGTTGTCYFRGAAAWKGMLLLSLARGGWVNTYYGNLELLDENDVRWFAKAQEMWMPLQENGQFSTFGGLPGKAQAYGYLARHERGALIAAVNPAQAVETIALPLNIPGRVLFHDKGFLPILGQGRLTLGPEQMCLVGFGEYTQPDYALGIQEDVLIPASIHKIDVLFHQDDGRRIHCVLPAMNSQTLRVVVRQFDAQGFACRTTGGSPPKGTSLGSLLKIRASQDQRPLPVTVQYDKAIWSGLSWAVGELKTGDRDGGGPVVIECSSSEKRDVTLSVEIFKVEYAKPG